MSRFAVLAIVAVTCSSAPCRSESFLIKDGQRVVFLGDSNTFAGKFITYIDAYLFARRPTWKVELINLGLPSETVSGLSEPDHPYPRPNVHDRLARALELTKPNLVIACYGMNDGIYYPFDEARFRKYQDGYRKLIDAVQKAGAKIVLMTPAPFDPVPLKDKVLAEGAEKYSWMRPYRDYDDVLRRYSQWLVSLRHEDFVVADAHAQLLKHLAAMRRRQPSYRVSGDGIHPDANGHAVIAESLLEALHAPPSEETLKFAVELPKDPSAKVSNVRLSWPGRLPMPADPAWNARLLEIEPLVKWMGRYRVIYSGLPPQAYELSEGDVKLGTLTREQLAAGVDVTGLAKFSVNRRSTDMLKLADERQTLLGRAWLTAVGHKRPDTPKGIALSEAQTKAKELEAHIRELCKPVETTLRLVPVQ